MSMDRRSFFASAGLVGALAAFKEKHEVESVAALRLAPDDILVFTVPHAMTMDGVERLGDTARELLGADRKVLVLTHGMTVSKLSPEDLNPVR